MVESAAHRLTRLRPASWRRPGASTVTGRGTAPSGRRPTLAAGRGHRWTSSSRPAPGQKLDETFGPSTRLEVSASPPELLLEGAGTGTELRRRW